MSRTFASIAAAGLLLSAGTVLAQEKWDLPTAYADGNFHTQNIRWFADELKKATNGKLELTIHSNASLFKMPEIKRAVSTGQVNIGEFLLNNFGNEDAMFEADTIPFLAAGYDAALKMYQVQKPFLEKRLQAQNMRILFSVAWPGQGVYSKTPMAALTDFKGVKFRAYSPTTARLAELLGAIPTTVQSAEVPQAFATGVVAAMITSSATGADTKAWEYAKYYYDTNAMHPRNVVVANERAFRRLPQDVQAAIMDLSAKAEKRGWDLSKENTVTTMKALTTNGMTVAEPPAQMMADFKKVGETMTTEWVKKAGPDGEAIVKAMSQ